MVGPTCQVCEANPPKTAQLLSWKNTLSARPKVSVGSSKTLAIVSGWEDFLVHNSKPTYELYRQLTFMAGCYGFLKKKSPTVLNQQERLAGPSLSIVENKKSQRYLSRPSVQKSSTKKNLSRQLDKAFPTKLLFGVVVSCHVSLFWTNSSLALSEESANGYPMYFRAVQQPPKAGHSSEFHAQRGRGWLVWGGHPPKLRLPTRFPSMYWKLPANP